MSQDKVLGEHVVARRVRYAVLLVALGALAYSGCSSAHGPEGVDTNTSWLKSCREDHECTGANARCIGSLCTLPCSPREPLACRPISSLAICSEPSGTCDLLCREDADCSTLGTGLTCQERSCREPPAAREPVALTLSSQTLQLESPAQQGTTRQSYDSTWLGDRWRVAVQATVYDSTSGPSPAFSKLALTDVYPDGSMQTDSLKDDQLDVISLDPLIVGQDGRVLVRIFANELEAGADASSSQRCEVRFHGPSSLSELHTVEDGCQFAPNAAVSVNADGDGLLFQTTSLSESTSDQTLRAGLYRPQDGSWTSPLNVLSTGHQGFSQLGLELDARERVSLYWQRSLSSSAFVTVPLSQLLTSTLADLPWRQVELVMYDGAFSSDARATGTTARGGWVTADRYPLGSDWISVDADGQPHPTAIRLDGGAEPIRVTLNVEEDTVWQQSAKFDALYPIPERNLLAYCRSDTKSDDAGQFALRLYLLDREGNVQAPPVEVARSADRFSSFQLSWSGESLLVVWLDETSDTAPHARIVRVSPGGTPTTQPEPADPARIGFYAP